MKDTSQLAHQEIQSKGTEETQARQILGCLAAGSPMTAQELGQATGLGAYTVSKRRGALLRSGCLEELPMRACRVTGRQAHPIRLTEDGVDVLEGGEVPVKSPSRREQELRVLECARRIADVWREVPEPTPSMRRLIDSVWNLDNARPRHSSSSVKEPWGSPFRVAKASLGVWVRRNGREVPMRSLTIFHLVGAIGWCRDNYCPEDAAPLRELLLEAGGRGVGAQESMGDSLQAQKIHVCHLHGPWPVAAMRCPQCDQVKGDNR